MYHQASAVPHCSSLSSGSYYVLEMLKQLPAPSSTACTGSKPVRKDQRGILCDNCEKWTHASCCGMNKAEYQQLGDSNDQWICPTCLRSQLPYANCSLDSVSHCYTNMAKWLHEGQEEWALFRSGGPFVGHLNVRSLIPKI